MQEMNELQEQSKRKVSLGVKVTSFFLMVFFFFPFCTVSCSGTSVEVTGAKAAFGTEVMGRQVDGKAVCALLLLIPLLILILYSLNFISGKLLAMLTAAGAVVDLIILFSFKSEITKMAEQAYSEVEFSFGYYGEVLLNIVLIILAVLYYKGASSSEATESTQPFMIQHEPREEQKSVASGSVCKYCGTPAKTGNAFCMNCGKAIEK